MNMLTTVLLILLRAARVIFQQKINKLNKRISRPKENLKNIFNLVNIKVNMKAMVCLFAKWASTWGKTK